MFSKKGPIYVDWYSLIHISSGILIGLILKIIYYNYGHFGNLKSYVTAGMVLIVAWEIFEIALRWVKVKHKKIYKFLLKFLPGYIFLREDKVNIISDIIIGASGLIATYFIF